MPVFHYKAKNKSAETIIGKIEALTKDDAIEKISRFELIPVSIEAEEKGGVKLSQKTSVKNGRVSQKELFLFSRQFASLLKAGVSILRALSVLQNQTKNLFFQKIRTTN